MKITLEPAALQEAEVIIRGDLSGSEVAAIVQALSKKPGSGKLILYKEDEQYIIDANEIVFVETGGTKVSVCTKTDTYETKLKLYELSELLPRPFVQISKSTIVNINCVKCIQAEFSGNYCVKLKNRKEVLTISRKYFKEFKERIQEV